MIIQEKISLAPYTTFKIGGPTKFFCVVTDETEVEEAVRYAQENKLRILVLGGGSNVLISDSGFDGLVIKMEIGGIIEGEVRDGGVNNETVSDQNQQPTTISRHGGMNNQKLITISVGAGENWDRFVEWVVEKSLYGIENLSSIPGTVGAVPVQNIGAYGQEVSTSIDKVRVFDVQEKIYLDIDRSGCAFGYRDSLFKKNKGRYIITRVDFVLQREGRVNIEYRDLKNYFDKLVVKKSDPPSISDVRQAVIDIRRGKLPDWRLWGTAGSFFKNPIVSGEVLEKIRQKYPDIYFWPQADGSFKVSAGWILDKICGARGLANDSNVGTYEKQALVLVARSGATAKDVVDFAHTLMNKVKQETGIILEAEVDWVN